MAETKTNASTRFFPPRVVADVDALSVAARSFFILASSGDFTQNSTVKTVIGPLPCDCTLIAGYQSFTTAPAGGTLSSKIVAYDASGNAEVDLTDALNPEALTSREGAAFTLAATNVALSAGDTLEVHQIASNDAVSQQQVGGKVGLYFKPTEATVISQ